MVPWTTETSCTGSLLCTPSALVIAMSNRLVCWSPGVINVAKTGLGAPRPITPGACFSRLYSRNQEILLLRLAAPGRSGQPAWHPSAAGPRVCWIIGIAILYGNLAALSPAAIKELTDIEAGILGDLEYLLPQRGAPGILL